MNSLARAAVSEYQSTGNSSIAYADPHELILRLMSGAIERIQQAKFAIKQDDTGAKGELIGKAIAIIAGLDSCLDRSVENPLVVNLEGLYEYMNLCLAEANVNSDVKKLDEVARLMGEIKSAWEQIPQETRDPANIR